MSLPIGRINMLVKSSILHDIGALKVAGAMSGDDMTIEMKEAIRQGSQDILSRYKSLDMDVEKLISQMQTMYCTEENGFSDSVRNNVNANIIFVADAYDRMTAMKSHEEPTSEVRALRQLLAREDIYDSKIVNALIRSINVLYPGVCVELSNGEKGLVIRGNEEDIFKPVVLSFHDNRVYDLTTTTELEIKDVMKTMDNRIKIDPDMLREYM